MTAKIIERFRVIATYEGERPDHSSTYATADAAIDSAAFLYKTGVPLRVWVREYSIDPSIAPKTIWRNGRKVV